jgi:hypothetical protein
MCVGVYSETCAVVQNYRGGHNSVSRTSKTNDCIEEINWDSTCLTVEAIVEPVDDIHRRGLKNDEPGLVFLDRGLLCLGDALDVLDI